jgi:anaerobic magnesium-protoporphyrin IX monomethyl ester cyclase
MRTLLVYPRFHPYSSPPLGLAYIAANMRAHGQDVSIFDGTFSNIEAMRRHMADYRPQLVALSVMTTNLRDAKECISVIRGVDKDVVIVAGGPHPSILPEETIRNYDVDIVVTGEGEETMVELSSVLGGDGSLSSVRGIYYRKGRKIVSTGRREPLKDLDSLPLPARDLLDMDKYLSAQIGRSSWTVPRPSTTVMGSRGCPYSCTFCAARLIHGRMIRKRSPRKIADEIEDLVRQHGIKGVWFNDDSFTLDRTWVMSIMKELDRRGVRIKWGCNTRVNLVDLAFLREMKKAGCRFISFGVESGVKRVRDKYLKKGTTNSEIANAFRSSAKAGIFTQATFMVGTPGETIAEMQESMEFAKRIKPDSIQVSITTPLPGTEIVDIAREMGSIDITDWEKIDYMWNGVIRTKDFTPDDARRMQRKFLMGFYSSPAYFFAQLSRIRSPSDLGMRVRGAMQLFWGNISPLSFLRNLKEGKKGNKSPSFPQSIGEGKKGSKSASSQQTMKEERNNGK